MRSKRVAIEELIIYLLLIGVGTIPIYNAVSAGAAIGVEATIGILMLLLGLVGLIGVVAALWRRAQPPASGGDDGDTGSRSR